MTSVPYELLIRLSLFVAAIFAVCGLGVIYMTQMPGDSLKGPLPPLTAGEGESAERIRSDLFALSGEIGERNFHEYEALIEAATWIESRLRSADLEPRRQAVDVDLRSFFNIEAVLPTEGSTPRVLVVGAHYDSVIGTPGADDNASGVVVALEIARLVREYRLRHELRFAFFVNEEPPYFRTPQMGSLEYARRLVDEEVTIDAMVSLEMLGCYSDEPGSQRYPLPLLGHLYPSRGNFVAFVGHLPSRALVRKSLKAFRQAGRFPSEGIVAPEGVAGVGWSDHWSFWQQGFPALMVTDTAFLRNPRYHEPTDTFDTLDVDAMARVAHGLVGVIEELDGTL